MRFHSTDAGIPAHIMAKQAVSQVTKTTQPNRVDVTGRDSDFAQFSLQVMEQVRPHLLGRTFIGRGQHYDDEVLDRFGLVGLTPNGGISPLIDGPLPAEHATQELQEQLEAGDGPVKVYVGELDFRQSDAWRCGPSTAPSQRL